MSQSAGLASSSHIGRAMLPQQQQPQLQRVRDRATAAATHADAATASPPPSQQPQQQQEQQQQQQQQQRSRRPRSIHITLRKTRSGSRPVNIQRSQLTGSGNPYGAQGYGVSSPSGPSASPRGGLRDSMDAFRGLDDTTPQRPLHHHQQQQYQQRQQRGSVPISYTDSAIALATLGTSYQAYTSSNGNGNGNGNGSPSSSFSSNTIAAGIGANVSPPSGSAAGPQLNTFMKPPYSSLQQLLPPSMRDRSGAANNGSGGGNSGGSGVVGGTDGWPAQTPQQQQQQNYAAAAHRLRSRSQLYMSGAGVYQLADGSSPSGAATTTTTTGSATAPVAQPPISRRRSSSSIGQLDGTTASHSGVLGDFVFPYPGRTTPLPQQQQQQQYQQQSGDAAVLPSGDGVEAAAAAAANGLTMTYLDVRSPRLYPPPSTAAGQDGGQPHRHHRARSYTAGGRHARPLTNRSHNGPVVTASMAGAGGAALFAGGTLPAPLTPQQQQQQHSNSVSHAESAATSRNLDRSLSLSSNPATPTPVNTAAAAAAAVGAATALTHNNVTTSRSSLRSGTTRETTPVTTAAAPSTGTTPRVMPHVSATPPAQQQQQQPQRQRPALSSTVKSPSSLISHQQYPLSMTPNATGGGNSAGSGGGGGGTAPTTPRASAITGRSTRKSGSFATRRSASSDMVNGLDDSVDSVLCGSLDTSGGGLAGQHDDSQHRDIDPNRKGGGSNYNNINNNNSSSSTPRRTSGYAAAGATHRYVVDSMTSDSSGGLLQHQHTQQQQQQQSTTPTNSDGSRHPRRYSMALTDEEEDSGAATTTNTPAAPAAATAAMSTIQRLRSRRDGGSGGRYDSRPPSSLAAGTATAQPPASTRGSEPQSAIERWRAQAEQKRRDEAQQSRRTGRHPQQQQQQQQHHHHHRLSARQWREAFRRLEEHRMKWTMRSFIGAGTSGKVYEGVLEDAAHTPVAVKVLDVRVPMPIGPGGGAAAATTSGGMAEDNTMSPAQQEALLVLLREVEMMEKLHHENIVTCLRCQVTPVHDRFMELHTQQQQQHGGRPPSQARPGDAGSATEQRAEDGCSGYASPQRCPPAAAPPRIPVQVEIIMELCKRGTLASVVRRSPGGQLPITTARRYLRDVLKGLAYLHRNNFIHRDVKGENVLISASDVAKLADFGCSRRIVMTNSHAAGEALDGTMSSLATTLAPDSRYTTVAEYQWCDATGVAQTMVGTPMFMAPEIIQASGAAPSLPPPPVSPHSVDSTDGCGEEREEGGRERSLHGGGGGGEGEHSPHRAAAAAPPPLGYTASADIWSFGCLVLEVFGRSPWPTAGNSVYHLMKQIEQSVDELPPGVPRDTPAELLSLLRCCFHRDPQRRSTARMLLRTPWMTCKDEELTEMPSRKRR